MKSICFAFILSVIFYPVNAQTGSLKGKIIDKTTKQPLPGTTILFKDSQIGTSADTSGSFVIRNINDGLYSIVVSFVGYQEKTINDVQISGGKTNYIEVEIEEAVTGLKEVIIKSFKFENVRSAPVSNYGFSREEISRNPGAQGDIFRAIGMYPGYRAAVDSFLL